MRTSDQICLSCLGKGFVSSAWGEHHHCPHCHGTGFKPATPRVCIICNGRGYRYRADKDGKTVLDDKGHPVMFTCYMCNGEGYTYH